MNFVKKRMSSIKRRSGAESFHGPVRDGKAWDQLAMAAKLKLLQIGKALIGINGDD